MTLNISILNVSGKWGTCNRSTTVVDMAPAKTYTSVAIPGSLYDVVEAPDNTKTSTATKVSRETTMGLEEAHNDFWGWRHTYSLDP